MEKLEFKVAPALAEAFKNANSEKKKLAEIMVNVWLNDLLSEKTANDKLAAIMERAGKEASNSGITSEILNNILTQDKGK